MLPKSLLGCVIVSSCFVGCGANSGSTGLGRDAGPSGSPGEVHKQAFLTYSTYTGDVGIAPADAACNEDGSIGFQNRQFVAWLSTSTDSASDRVGSGPWWVGNELLGTLANLVANQLGTTFNRTPTGSVVAHGEYVWTGTESGGVAAATTCADWTSKSDTVTGEMGQVGYADVAWTAATTPSCDHDGHLYCFEK